MNKLRRKKIKVKKFIHLIVVKLAPLIQHFHSIKIQIQKKQE